MVGYCCTGNTYMATGPGRDDRDDRGKIGRSMKRENMVDCAPCRLRFRAPGFGAPVRCVYGA
jgi:hypothetical protein